MQQNSALYSVLFRSIVLVVLVLIASFWVACAYLGIKIDDKTNISDIYANILNITILLLTVFVLNRITERSNKLDRSISFEKGIILDRVNIITTQTEELYDIIESGSSPFQALNRRFSTMLRISKNVGDFIHDPKSLLVGDKGDIQMAHSMLEDAIEKLRGILLDTPIRQSAVSTSVHSYITISGGLVTFHDSGISAARLNIGEVSSISIKLAMSVNRL